MPQTRNINESEVTVLQSVIGHHNGPGILDHPTYSRRPLRGRKSSLPANLYNYKEATIVGRTFRLPRILCFPCLFPLSRFSAVFPVPTLSSLYLLFPIMKFTPALTNLFFVFSTLFAFASAAPISKRDVFVPPVTYPNGSTVWKVGARHNVTWCVRPYRSPERA